MPGLGRGCDARPIHDDERELSGDEQCVDCDEDDDGGEPEGGVDRVPPDVLGRSVVTAMNPIPLP